jgi:hypothetical protein
MKIFDGQRIPKILGRPSVTRIIVEGEGKERPEESRDGGFAVMLL